MSTLDTEPAAPQFQSRLLSLPWELRDMIWKAMLDDTFLLHTIPYDLESADHITTTHAIHSSPSYLKTTCNSFHTEPAHEPHSNIEPAKHPAPSPVGALSWLRTCRLIYSEAKPLLANNLSLHICDKVTLGAAFGGRTPTLPLSQIRSLDFCARLEVKWDLEDGFMYGKSCFGPDKHPTMQGEYEKYRRHLRRLNRLVYEINRLDYTQLPSLQTVTLFVSFECVPFQGNDLAELDRSGQSAWRLQLKGDNMDWLCSFRPYTLFNVFIGSVPVPNVRFDLAGIRHNPWNLCPNVGDQCWCRGKSIDADSVPWEETRRRIIALLKDTKREGMAM